jgi:hypothetical protein
MNRKLKKLLGLIATFGMLSMSAFSYAGPAEICFGVNHPSLPLNSTSPVLNSLNTTSPVSSIHNSLYNGGYTNSSYYINNRGSTIISNMTDKAVFYFSGHGGPGRFWTTYQNNGDWVLDRITAEVPTNNGNGLYGYLGNNMNTISNTSNKMKYTKLAYFSSCYSAWTDDSSSPAGATGYNLGNLMWKAAGLGADSVLAFSNTVNASSSEYFDKQFFTNILFVLNYPSGSNKTVSQAAQQALSETIFYHGSSGGAESYTIAPINPSGETIKLKPAAYGVY